MPQFLGVSRGDHGFCDPTPNTLKELQLWKKLPEGSDCQGIPLSLGHPVCPGRVPELPQLEYY
jgi:hypothetical protein